jgi:hypothetical protein
MSRSGYSDDLEPWALIKWRGRVASAIRGKRGQRMLRDLLAALDAMPIKELIDEELQVDGAYCALGLCGHARGLDMSVIDPYDSERIAKALDIAEPLAQEVASINDDDFCYRDETPAARWVRVREWVVKHIRDDAVAITPPPADPA